MPQAEQQIRPFAIKKAGTNLSDTIYNKIISIEVDDSLSIPSMFTIRLLLDPHEGFQFLDSNDFSIGQEIEIKAEDVTLLPSQESSEETIMKGEITAIEPLLSTDSGSTLLIRGYDQSHRLHRGTKTRSFVNTTDSDIVKKIAGENGLAVDADSTSVTHEHVYQNSQTDWEFLSARASRVGYTLYVKDSKLYFKKDLPSSPSANLEWASELLQFNARVSAANQVDKVIVQGFDPEKQSAISAEKVNPSEWDWGKIGKMGGQQAKESFGGSRQEVIADRPVAQVTEAGLIAQSVLDGYAQRYIQADCECLGRPKVRAGELVELSRLGTRFSGKYRVTHARHIYNGSEGYRTEFTVGNRHISTVTEILAPRQSGTVQGPVLGIITNNNDEEGKQGRVKIKYPWLSDQIESHWARLIAPGAGKERGLHWMPEIDDEVLVIFEHNDFNRPLVIGGLWSDKNKIPIQTSEAVKGGKVNKRILMSRSGHVITMDDSEGKEQIIICDKTKNNEIIIDSANNSMTVKADKDITIEAKGKIIVSTSNGDITFEGNNLSIKTKQAFNVDAKGACSIKSIQSCTVEGTAGLTLKNAAAQIAMSGPTVNINNGALEIM